MGNLTMDIKQRLTQMIDIQNENPPIDIPMMELCRDALAEIERLQRLVVGARTGTPPHQTFHHVEFHPDAHATVTRAVVAFERIARALEKAPT